jgi:hypothetical protein
MAYSVCPSGWRLPIGSSSVSTDEFAILDRANGGTGCNYTNTTTAPCGVDCAFWLLGGAWNGRLVGYTGTGGYVGYHNPSSGGSSGRDFFWSDGVISDVFNYGAVFGVESGGWFKQPHAGSWRGWGYSVRCISNYQ